MRSPAPDLSGLAALARDPRLDLRPVILRVQADLFVGAPARDDATIASFSALATGLLPTVDDETALVVASKLAPCPDTPIEVVRLLISRGGAIRRAILSRPDEASSVEAEEMPRRVPDAEPGCRAPLAAPAGQSPQASLAEARSSGGLARLLLRRGDLSPGDEALLYLHAEPERRARIRANLAPLAGLRPAPPPRAEAASRERVIGRAAQADLDGFAAELGAVLGLDRPLALPDLRMEAGQEVLALALHAAGFAEEECVRIFLTLDPGLARSVRAVFSLAALIRATPRAVAAHLVEAVLGAEIARAPARHQPAMDASGAAQRGAGLSPAGLSHAGLAQAARERRMGSTRERRAG